MTDARSQSFTWVPIPDLPFALVPTYLAIHMLGRRDDETEVHATPGLIATLCECSRARAEARLRRLESLGVVRRVVDPTDGQVVGVVPLYKRLLRSEFLDVVRGGGSDGAC